MKGVLSLLLLTSACIAVTPLPLLSGVLNDVGGVISLGVDAAKTIGSLITALPCLVKISVLNDISVTATALANSPQYPEIRSRWTGGDFVKLADALGRAAKVLNESRGSSGDLNLLKLSNFSPIITDTADAIVHLRNSIERISTGGIIANDSIQLSDGLSALKTALYSLADALNNTDGPGAVAFCAVLSIFGVTNGLSKMLSGCQRLGEVDPNYPFAAVAEALSAVVDAINKGSQ